MGVIASLVFVALEIRQNTEAVKSTTIQAISEQSFNATILTVQNNELLKAIQLTIENEKLSVEQHLRLGSFYAAIIRVQKNRFLQIKLGILDIETALFMGAKGPVFQNPYFVEWWEMVRSNEPKEFVEYFETHVMQLNSDSE